MPTFKIIDIHKITDRGLVLSGVIIDKGIILTSDNIVFKNGFDNYIFKIIDVTAKNEKKHFDILISSNDFDKIREWEIKEKDFKIVSIVNRQKLTSEPIIWAGDLKDDCTAKWAGLLLRAEWMDEDSWWWEVSDIENPEIEIDSSNNYEASFIDGDISRKTAEDVARKYLRVN